MRAILQCNKWIWFDNITQPEEDILWEEFSVSKPNAYIDPDQLRLWDGVYRKYNRAKQRMARPLLSMLRGVCTKHNLPLEIVDNRDPWSYEIIDQNLIDENFLPGITLDQHQIVAIKKACKIECGIISVPTGGGKGEIICGICKAIDCPTVIIADQKVVIDQLKTRLELREIDSDIGMFYGGKRPSGQTIVVGSIQSLQSPTKKPEKPKILVGESEVEFAARMGKWKSACLAYHTRCKNAKYLQGYVERAEMLIADECDKAVSEPFKKLFRNMFSGRRRYGFSGTPFDVDKPVEGLVMQEHLGSIIAKESRENLTAIGRIIKCDYTMLAVGPFDNIRNSDAFDIAINDHMVNSFLFHRLISGVCKTYEGDGTLILVERELLGLALVEELKRVGSIAHFIYGKTTKRRRNELLRSFERREYNVLIGGKIINRGLDLAGGCENLIIATGGKLQSDLDQKIGRAVRNNSRGRSRVFDFFFRCNKHLYNHSKARLQTMISLGYDTRVIFPGGSIDGKELVKRRFQIPRRLFESKRTSQKQLFTE